ncbi:MAG TPA: hypothetical protein VMY77_00355 [Chitinophagaceae bacterium]|nr:hypothetical protein [Chitinophagaceae bacterium]
MKALLSLLFILAISCNQSNPKQEAKELSKIIFDGVDSVESGKSTRQHLDRYYLPMQKRVDSLIATLSEEDKKEVRDYRTELYNDLVDKKVAREKNK